ncbi:MAG: aspartate ammonia-lyase [Ruminococcaceae bacterium]|nr:aspartate ammonia-lyase [Oscillospiraceae bacterium]
MNYREEFDSLGRKEVPEKAYYGVQSLRAYENFQITGKKVHLEMVRSIAEIKMAAAIANRKAGVLTQDVSDAIVQACKDILNGRFIEEFIVDSVQGGAGTSFNMNANEVIANRAIEYLGGKKGDYSVVHPNDHVNCGQSTNDVYPSAGKIAIIRLLQKAITELNRLHKALQTKAEEYADVIKMGRTEMQDAVPISFGQVFNAFASAILRDRKRFTLAMEELSVLNMGGTAIGTGINADEKYIQTVVPTLAEITTLPLVQAEDLIDATQNLDSFVFVSGIIKSCATTLSKMSNDLRLMSSGPRAGFEEINLSPKQNGSSIMPGKVNPVIPEVMSQISFRVIGNDTTVTHAAEAGQLELNAFEPIIFHCLLESLDMLTNGIRVFTSDCIKELTVNRIQCREYMENSIGIVTALCPYIGYAKASSFAKKALKENKSIREIILEASIMDKDTLDKVLNPLSMI